MPDHGKRMPLLDANSIKYLGMTDDFESPRLAVVIFGKDFQETGDAAKSGNHTVLLGDDRTGGPQLGINGEGSGEVLGRLVLTKSLFEEGGDAFALPVHSVSVIVTLAQRGCRARPGSRGARLSSRQPAS